MPQRSPFAVLDGRIPCIVFVFRNTHHLKKIVNSHSSASRSSHKLRYMCSDFLKRKPKSRISDCLLQNKMMPEAVKRDD